MQMPRYIFPDPDDRSKNDPSVIVDSQRVLGLYNQDNDEGYEMQRITAKVQEWFKSEAKAQGWDKADFVGNQCLLENNFIK